MQNRTSVWFFPFLCDPHCIQTMWTQLIKLIFCVSIFSALVITELPLIPNYCNIFFPSFYCSLPACMEIFLLCFDYTFLLFSFHFSILFFFIFFSSTSPQFLFLTIRIFHPSSVDIRLPIFWHPWMFTVVMVVWTCKFLNHLFVIFLHDPTI